MSSNIKIQRICKYCNNEFTARTTLTKYCSPICNSRDYKAKIKAAKIGKSNKEAKEMVSLTFQALKTKEFLTVKEVAALLNCSVKSVYRYINDGHIKAVNLGNRLTRIKRSTLDGLFDRS